MGMLGLEATRLKPTFPIVGFCVGIERDFSPFGTAKGNINMAAVIAGPDFTAQTLNGLGVYVGPLDLIKMDCRPSCQPIGDDFAVCRRYGSGGCRQSKGQGRKRDHKDLRSMGHGDFFL